MVHGPAWEAARTTPSSNPPATQPPCQEGGVCSCVCRLEWTRGVPGFKPQTCRGSPVEPSMSCLSGLGVPVHKGSALPLPDLSFSPLGGQIP